MKICCEHLSGFKRETVRFLSQGKRVSKISSPCLLKDRIFNKILIISGFLSFISLLYLCLFSLYLSLTDFGLKDARRKQYETILPIRICSKRLIFWPSCPPPRFTLERSLWNLRQNDLKVFAAIFPKSFMNAKRARSRKF